MSAAGKVLEAFVFDLGGVVGVAGPGRFLQLRIVLGPCVGVFDLSRKGCAAEGPVLQPGEDCESVGFLPGRGQIASSRSPPVQKTLELIQVRLEAIGKTFRCDPDGGGVGLPKNRKSYILTVG